RQLVIDNLAWTGYTGAAVEYPPVARAGSDQFAIFGDIVTLDGSASSDRNNNIESYLWTQIGGSAVSLNNSNSVVTTFTTPSENTTLLFELLVTDSTSLTDRDTVQITVRETILNEVFFSEYIEGSSNNKALEIYNGSGTTVNLDDFRIAQANDGNGWQYYHYFPEGATLANDNVWVIINESVSTSLFNHTDADEILGYPSVVTHNGNDARGLQWTPDGGVTWVLVDVFGDPNSDANFDVAGVSGAAAEHTLIRKSHIEAGNTDWTSSAGTNSDDSEWIVMEQDYFSDLGSHTAGPQAYTINNIEVATAFPQAGSEIEVKANVIPGESSPAPSSVKLWYGSGGTQANSVDMFLESGTVYAAAIPSIADGNLRLEYYVQASNGSSSSKSSVRSILVAGTPMSISEIHANIQTLDGQIKTIEGVVTIGAGALRDDRTSAYLQDNSGRGLNIYAETFYAELERGVKVRMVGEVDQYYTTVELKDFNYRVISTGEALPAPVSVSVAGANSSALEGTLAKVTGTLDKIIDYTGSKNLILKDGTDTTIVKIWGTTGINTDAFQTGILYAITGVGSQYSDEYQLLVGYADDIDPTVAVGETDAPDAFALAAPYPNPFNPATTVTYRLDRPGTYSLGVFNLTGRQVASLAQGYAEAGEYSLSWNAADFTSGIYFIRLEAARSIATRKVVLIK
ncbi:MAG: T9SS type A sorting domain-containing protein, partial [Candidatus Marinimicrobia bacterium]|nr:T9SS type A sorting domain-containing protein [Candidatus Neomarinimicrobiota bacterium]